jgi:hypothetical protein
MKKTNNPLRELKLHNLQCLLAALIGVSGAAYLLWRAYAHADVYIRLDAPPQETTLVFVFATLALCGLTCLIISVPIVLYLLMNRPQLRALQDLKDRIIALEKQQAGESEHHPGA